MPLKTTLIAALLAATIVPAMAANTGGGKALKVVHRIDVATEAGKVLVHVKVENHSDRTIYVPREIAAEKELTGRRFEVRELAANTSVDYTGRMVKRGPLTAADYQAVGPRAMHLNTIDITNTYAFQKGRHSYELSYAGPWLADVTRLDQVSYSPSSPVRFTYTRK
jgi:hypothetical protein